MVVRFVPNARDHDRFGISTGRRLGGAVQRNHVRRRVREILRQAPNETGHGWDILIVARPASVGASFNELRATLERLLDAIRNPVNTPS
jgi:ribonuclease P protein component